MKNYLIGLYEKAFPEVLSISEMLQLAKESGYDFFEISIDRTEKRIARLTDKKFIRDTKEAMNKFGIPISSMGLSSIGTYTLGHSDKEVLKYAKQIVKDAIQFALELNIRIIQIPAADMPKFEVGDSETKERFILNVTDFVMEAAQYGILVGLENMENEFMDTTQKCLEVIHRVNSPYLQLYTDSGNLTNAFKCDIDAIKDDMKKGQGHYLGFHIKEVREGKYGGLFYGEGIVPFEKVIAQAYELGARRFCMEYWYTGSTLWKEELVDALEMCESWLK